MANQILVHEYSQYIYPQYPKRLNKLNIHQQINAKPTTLYIYNRISPLKSNDPMPTMYKARGVLL